MYQYIFFSIIPLTGFLFIQLVSEFLVDSHMSYIYLIPFIILLSVPLFIDKERISWSKGFICVITVCIIQSIFIEFGWTESLIIFSCYLTALLLLFLFNSYPFTRFLLPLALVPAFIFIPFLEYKSHQVPDSLNLYELFQPQFKSHSYLSMTNVNNLIRSSHKSVLFPLSSSPLVRKQGQLIYSKYWHTMYMTLKKTFPVFYIFKSGENYWYYGNKSKSFRGFFNAFKTNLTNQDTSVQHQSRLAYVLLHQSLSFDGLAYDSQALSKWSKSKVLFNPFLDKTDIPLHEYHKVFPYLLYKELFSKEENPILFSKETIQKVVLKLITNEEYLVAENLIYLYFSIYGMDESYTVMITMLSTAYPSPQASIALILTKDPTTASDAFLYQSFKLFEYQESLFSSYGKAYKYEPIIGTLRKLYKRTKSMEFQNKILHYSSKQNKQLEFVGCGCID